MTATCLRTLSIPTTSAISLLNLRMSILKAESLIRDAIKIVEIDLTEGEDLIRNVPEDSMMIRLRLERRLAITPETVLREKLKFIVNITEMTEKDAQ